MKIGEIIKKLWEENKEKIADEAIDFIDEHLAPKMREAAAKSDGKWDDLAAEAGIGLVKAGILLLKGSPVVAVEEPKV